MRKSQFIMGAVFAGLSLGQSHDVFAGLSGQMNGLGVGKANANVRPPSATLPTSVTDANVPPPPGQALQILGAAVQTAPVPAGFVSSTLPAGSTTGTFSYIQGEPNYKWTALTTANGGDKTDNATVEEIMDVIPSTFAALTLSSALTILQDGTRRIDFNGVATAGTGLLLQVFQTTSETTFGFQSLADEPVLENIFYQPHTGTGEPLASGQIPVGSVFHYFFDLPKGVPDSDLIVQIDGLAVSSAPDSGSLVLAFGLTVAGMLLARRFVTVPASA